MHFHAMLELEHDVCRCLQTRHSINSTLRLAGLIDWSVGWLVGWLVGGLVGWLVGQAVDLFVRWTMVGAGSVRAWSYGVGAWSHDVLTPQSHDVVLITRNDTHHDILPRRDIPHATLCYFAVPGMMILK